MERTEGEFRFLPVGGGRGGRDYLASEAQMEALDRYITAALEKAAIELAAGNIDADPYWRDAQHNACRWCDYRSACHFEAGCGDAQRFRRGVSAAEFWQWMSRREEDDENGY